MFFLVAAAIFVTNDGETFAESGGKIGSRVLYLVNHEWTRIYTKKKKFATTRRRRQHARPVRLPRRIKFVFIRVNSWLNPGRGHGAKTFSHG